MTDVTKEGTASSRILDRRYQRYAGPRKGEVHATWRLTIHAFQRLLGLRRPFKYKIVPILLALGCFAFPLGLIFIAAFIPGGNQFSFSYGQLFQIISLPIFLFVVITGPNGLITDRSTKSLSLYLASPLTRNSYLGAHGAAVFGVLSVVTVGPALMYFLSTVIQGTGPDGFVGAMSILGKILLAGGFLSLFYGAITMVAGALAERPGVAAGAIFLGFTGLDLLGFALAEQLDNGFLRLLSVGDIPDQIVATIFDNGFVQETLRFDVSTTVVVAGGLVWIGLALGLTWRRYQKLVISR
jgi:hypothetical protein